VKALAALKGDVQALLGQADAQQEAEVGRLVAVFSAMKAKDAAARFNQLDESVRLPIAAKMKERTLAAILAQMSPAESKALTENLAKRFTANKTLASARAAVAPEAPATTAAAAAPPAGGPRPQAAAPAPARAPAPTPPAAAPAARAG
jgi:flagellar motility protein MotE (MotC chaperone)